MATTSRQRQASPCPRRRPGIEYTTSGPMPSPSPRASAPRSWRRSWRTSGVGVVWRICRTPKLRRDMLPRRRLKPSPPTSGSSPTTLHELSLVNCCPLSVSSPISSSLLCQAATPELLTLHGASHDRTGCSSRHVRRRSIRRRDRWAPIRGSGHFLSSGLGRPTCCRTRTRSEGMDELWPMAARRRARVRHHTCVSSASGSATVSAAALRPKWRSVSIAPNSPSKCFEPDSPGRSAIRRAAWGSSARRARPRPSPNARRSTRTCTINAQDSHAAILPPLVLSVVPARVDS